MFDLGTIIPDSLLKTKALFQDFSPFLYVFFGVGIGMAIIDIVFDFIEERNERKWFTSGGFEHDPFLTPNDKRYYRQKHFKTYEKQKNDK